MFAENILVIGNRGSLDIEATLAFKNGFDQTKIQTFIDAYEKANDECTMSELIKAVCAAFDAEEVAMEVVYA